MRNEKNDKEQSLTQKDGKGREQVNPSQVPLKDPRDDDPKNQTENVDSSKVGATGNYDQQNHTMSEDSSKGGAPGRSTCQAQWKSNRNIGQWASTYGGE